MEELTNPFADKRGTYKELSDEKLFYKLSKETPLSFRKFSIVSCKVERVKKDIIIVKIMENGLKGNQLYNIGTPPSPIPPNIIFIYFFLYRYNKR